MDGFTCGHCGLTMRGDEFIAHAAEHDREDGTTKGLAHADKRYARSTTVEHARDLDPRY